MPFITCAQSKIFNFFRYLNSCTIRIVFNIRSKSILLIFFSRNNSSPFEFTRVPNIYLVGRTCIFTIMPIHFTQKLGRWRPFFISFFNAHNIIVTWTKFQKKFLILLLFQWNITYCKCIRKWICSLCSPVHFPILLNYSGGAYTLLCLVIIWLCDTVLWRWLLLCFSTSISKIINNFVFVKVEVKVKITRSWRNGHVNRITSQTEITHEPILEF